MGACHRNLTTRDRDPPSVILQTPAREVRVRVELARTEEERQRGLMFRTELAPGSGMLFLFDHDEKLRFWMKNTYIPLDMIFINRDLRIVGIEENAEPLTVHGRGPDVEARYVLEVPGGWCRSNGVEAGAAVRFVEVD